MVNREIGLKKQIECTKMTKMIDLTINLVQQLNSGDKNASDPKNTLENINDISDNIPADLLEIKTQNSQNLTKLFKDFEPISEIITSEKVNNLFEIYGSNNEEMIKQCYLLGLPKNFINIIYENSVFLYEIGKYNDSRNLAKLVCSLVDKKSYLFLECLWGQLSSAIATEDLETATALFETIKTELESAHMSHYLKIQNFNQLLHLSLFLFFRSSDSDGSFSKMCLNQPYFKQTLETVANHLARYVIVSEIVHIEEEADFKNLMKMVTNIMVDYSDCFLLFVNYLFNDLDLDNALVQFWACVEVLLS